MSDNNDKFEDNLRQLEQIISNLESGSMPLEDMVTQVEKGAQLVKNCRSRLEAMNSKVEILFKDDGAAGEFTEFDPATDRAKAATGETTPPPAPSRRKRQPPTAPPQDDLPF